MCIIIVHITWFIWCRVLDQFSLFFVIVNGEGDFFILVCCLSRHCRKFFRDGFVIIILGILVDVCW